MGEKVAVTFVARGKQKSEYDWANISVDNQRGGKLRCSISGNTLTIWSINVFPEFEGRGYARQSIEVLKHSFDTIIADRVRFTAIGFWERMGFAEREDGTWIAARRRRKKH